MRDNLFPPTVGRQLYRVRDLDYTQAALPRRDVGGVEIARVVAGVCSWIACESRLEPVSRIPKRLKAHQKHLSTFQET